MIQNLKKKIELSKLLGEIETNFDSMEIVKKLDSLHSKPKAHVIGITGSPGAGKSSLIDKLVRFIRKKKSLLELLLLTLPQKNLEEHCLAIELDFY